MGTSMRPPTAADGSRTLARRRTWPVFAAGIVAASLLAAAPAVAQERQYELVSPADDRFYNAVFRAADPDLNGVYYQAGGSSGSPEPAWNDGAVPDAFGATRTAQGWQTSWLTPYCPNKFSVHDPGSCTDTSEGPGPEPWVAAGNGRIIFASTAPLPPGKSGWSVSPLDPWPTREIYAGDAQTTSQLGWETLPASDGWGVGIDEDEWVAASADQSTVAFVSEDVRRPEAAGLPAGRHLYVRRGSSLQLASDPVGGASGGECGGSCEIKVMSSNYDGGYWQTPAVAHVVSDSGQRVFFATNRRLHPDATAGRQEVYVLDGDDLRLLSDGLTNPAGVGAASGFHWAAANGSRAFVVTGGGSGASGRVWAVDVPSEAATPVTPAGINAFFVWASDDGSTALVRSTASFADAPAVGGQKLYVWRAGAGVSYVGALNGADSLLNDYAAARDVHATSDGSTIVFSTRAALDPADTNGAADLYRLRGADLTWLTPRSGAGAAGHIAMTYDVGVRGIGGDFQVQVPQALLEDAETVLFTTTATLVPEDTDGGKEDVYSVRDGQYTLITPPGDAQEDAWLNANSPDGSIVLFTTRAAVTEVDTDDGMADIYSARTSGAFADKLPSSTTGAPPVAAGPGVAAPVPSAPSAGSAGSSSPSVDPVPVVPEWPADPGASGGDGSSGGELGLEDSPVFRARRVVVPLVVPGRGQARVVLKGRVGKRTRTLARGSRSFARGGERSVRLRLTRHGRRFDGRRVTVRVVFVGADGERQRLRERTGLGDA